MGMCMYSVKVTRNKIRNLDDAYDVIGESPRIIVAIAKYTEKIFTNFNALPWLTD
jgi:hypothetical protein